MADGDAPTPSLLRGVAAAMAGLCWDCGLNSPARVLSGARAPHPNDLGRCAKCRNRWRCRRNYGTPDPGPPSDVDFSPRPCACGAVVRRILIGRTPVCDACERARRDLANEESRMQRAVAAVAAGHCWDCFTRRPGRVNGGSRQTPACDVGRCAKCRNRARVRRRRGHADYPPPPNLVVSAPVTTSRTARAIEAGQLDPLCRRLGVDAARARDVLAAVEACGVERALVALRAFVRVA